MQPEQEGIRNIEADVFAGIHLSETGVVADFIQKIISEIKNIPSEEKEEYLLEVIRRVNKESDLHNSICIMEHCSTKEYFKECLTMLELFCELRRLS